MSVPLAESDHYTNISRDNVSVPLAACDYYTNILILIQVFAISMVSFIP